MKNVFVALVVVALCGCAAQGLQPSDSSPTSAYSRDEFVFNY